MDRRERIENRLRDALAAERVEVVDESHLHVGHAGARGGGGHFRAVIVSDRFAGQSAVERQRMVYAVLAGEMKAEIHALSMRTFTLDEWNQQV
jgi:BolA protein